MLDLKLKDTRIYQEAKEEGKEEGREEMLAITLPLLLKSGLTIEQIAEQTGLDLETIRRLSQS